MINNLLQSETDWQDKAACRGMDPAIFYGPNEDDEDYEPGSQMAATVAAAALKHCEPCPVRRECLAFAIKNDEKFGIWGGLSRSERTKVVTRTRKARAAKALAA